MNPSQLPPLAVERLQTAGRDSALAYRGSNRLDAVTTLRAMSTPALAECIDYCARRAGPRGHARRTTNSTKSTPPQAAPA